MKEIFISFKNIDFGPVNFIYLETFKIFIHSLFLLHQLKGKKQTNFLRCQLDRLQTDCLQSN